MNNKHDKGYKDLFSNKETFITLLRSFVNEPWVDEIDENNLEYVNKSYVLHDFAEKEADIVYRMNFKGTNVIFYCLLELQSTPDKSMPIRLLFYINEIWREWIKNNKEATTLPAIIPMVLYNGKQKWTVPINFKEMINGHEIFKKHLVDFSYILFDVTRYDESELFKLANLVSTIFYLDKEYKLDEIVAKLNKLINIIKKMNQKDVRFLKRWLRFIVKSKMPKSKRSEFDRVLDENVNLEVEEMVSNFGNSIEKAFKESERRGKAEGERIKAEDIARKMLKKDTAIEEIIEMTELTYEDIIKLKENIK